MRAARGCEDQLTQLVADDIHFSWAPLQSPSMPETLYPPDLMAKASFVNAVDGSSSGSTCR